MPWGNYLCAILLTITTIAKVTQHINTFSGLKLDVNNQVISNGWIWDVKQPIIGGLLQANDAIWMLCALVVPMIESGYLTWKKFDSHGLIVVIEDNKRARNGYEKVSDQCESSDNPA